MSTDDLRLLLIDVLTYHVRVEGGGGCACGWNVLGASWAEHVADIWEESTWAKFANRAPRRDP